MTLNNGEIGTKHKNVFGLIIFLASLITGLLLIGDIGPAAIETTNFEALKRQNEWFSNLGTENFQPFSAETINKYWRGNQDCDQRVIDAVPPLSRTLMGIFQPIGKLFAGNWESLRAFPVICFSLLTALLFCWLVSHIGFSGALAASLIFAFIPRALANGIQADHFSFLALIWFMSGRVFLKDNIGKSGIILFGVLAGIGMSISVTFHLLCITVLLWAIFSGNFVKKIPLFISGVIGSLIIPIILNPLWWHNPVGGYIDYMTTNIVGRLGYTIPVEYFGQLYQSGLPWHYVIVMLLFTFPVVSLAFVLGGKLVSAIPENYKGPAGFALTTSTLFIVTGLFARFPASEGMSWFLPLYAADAIMGAYGFVWLMDKLAPHLKSAITPIKAVGLAAIAIPPLVLMINLFPAMSSHYNPLIGFLRGADKAGLETVFDSSILNRQNINKINETALGIIKDKARKKVDDNAENADSTQQELKVYIKDVGTNLNFLRKRGVVPGEIVFHHYLFNFSAAMDRPGDFIPEDYLLDIYGSPVLEYKKGNTALFKLYNKDTEYDRIFDLLVKKGNSKLGTSDDAYYIGVLYSAAHRFKNALQYLDLTLANDSTRADANFLYGYIKYYESTVDSSLVFFDKAVEGDPDNTEYLHYSGMAYKKIDQNDKAYQVLEKAAEIDPYNTDINNELGELCLKMGKFDLARSVLERSIVTDTLNLNSMFLIANSYIAEDNREMALKSYDRIEYYNPKHPIYLRTKAEMFEKWDEWDKAAECYEKLLTLRDNYPMVMNRLADIYYVKLNNHERALELYEKLVAYQPHLLNNIKLKQILNRLKREFGKEEIGN